MEKTKNPGLLNIDTTLYKTNISDKFAARKPYRPADPRQISSFIPGTILDILVEEGQEVREGDDLIILDAMKMQNILKSKVNGKIKCIVVSKGEKVSRGRLLMEME